MLKMASRHHNQVFTNQRMLNQGKSTRFARSYKVTIVGEDKGEGRHTGSLHSLCCRGRSCSSRTSRCPPRSCSSRTPCSTPGREEASTHARSVSDTRVAGISERKVVATNLVLGRASSPRDPAFWGKTHRKTQIS